MSAGTFFRNKFVKSWPKNDLSEATEGVTAPLSEILTFSAGTDAHLAPYVSPDPARRLSKGAESRLETGVQMMALVIDVDAPESGRVGGKKKAPATEAWWTAEKAKVERFRQVHEGAFVYRTQGGYRIVMVLAQPFVIRNQRDASRWNQDYLIALASLSRRFGIEGDRNCKDWTRLYRAPHATRRPGSGPEQMETIGDPNAIGIWRFEPTEEDRQAAGARRRAPAMPVVAPIVTTAVASSGPLAFNAEAIRRQLASYSSDDPERTALVRRVVAGQPLAEVGARDATLFEAVATITQNISPEVPGETVITLLRPSLEAMPKANSEDTTEAWLVKAEKMWNRVHPGWADRCATNRKGSEGLRALVARRVEHAAAARADTTAGAPQVHLALMIGDEVEVARRVVGDLGREGPVVFAEGLFHRYDAVSGTWMPIPDDELSCAVQAYSGARIGQNGVIRVSNRFTKGAIALASAQVGQPDFFRQAAAGITFVNGFVSVTDSGVTVRPHSPEWRSRTALPYDYDAAAPCPRWNRYLREVFEGGADADAKIALLQEFVGACLFGIAVRYQQCLVLLGTGSNGKSVFLMVITKLFPQDCVAAIPPHEWGNEYRRAALAGTRLNAVNELPRAEIMHSEPVKAIITGDEIDGRPIYGKPVKVRPMAGHIFAANTLPDTDDTTHAFFRRFVVVSFNRVFGAGEADRELPDRIIATEMPGIAAWAVEGAARLLARGVNGSYTIPASHGTEMKEWELNANKVRRFIEECMEPAFGDERISGAELYRLFVEWAKANGHAPLSNTKFGPRVEALGYRKVKPDAVNFYPLRVRLSAPEAARLFLDSWTIRQSSGTELADLYAAYGAWCGEHERSVLTLDQFRDVLGPDGRLERIPLVLSSEPKPASKVGQRLKARLGLVQ